MMAVPELVRAEYTGLTQTYAAWDADDTRYTVKAWSGWGPLYVYPGTDTSQGSVGEVGVAEMNEALGIPNC